MTGIEDHIEGACDGWFVQLVTEHQRALYLHVLSLVPRPTEAEEIVQETNLLIWQKRSEFQRGTSFRAWAFQIAYLKVLKHRTKRGRDNTIFSDKLVEAMAAESVDRSEQSTARQRALEQCMAKLHPSDSALIAMRYRQGSSVIAVAEKLGRPVNSVYQSLGRIRKALARCILRRLSLEEGV